TKLPDAERNSEPQRKKGECYRQSGWFVPEQNATDDCSINRHREGSGEHRARFCGGVKFPVVTNREAKGGESDGGSGAEETGKTLGPEDVGKHREEADDDTTDEEAKKQDCHGVRRREGFSRRMTSCRLLCLLDEAHGFASFSAAEEFILFAFEPVI